MKLINLIVSKNKNIFTICLFACVLTFALSSCGDDNSSLDSDSTEQSSSTMQNQAGQGGNAASATLVQHYICSKGCAGSGSSTAGNCPVCGDPYTHNDAWHSPEAMAARGETPAAENPGTIQFDPNNPPPVDFKNQMNAPAAPQMDTPSPAQNTKGVWHYTCSAGCEGGAGTAGKCSKCGKDLVHNAAYHN